MFSGMSRKSGARHPPLSCRTPPPQGGRSECAKAFANRKLLRLASNDREPISPLAGEMPTGRGGRLAQSYQYEHRFKPC